MLLAMWMWAACTPWVARIEPAPVGARDGDVLAHAGPIHVALLGHADRAPPSLFRALTDRAAQVVVLAGDAVSRSRPAQWRRLHDRVEGLTVLPVAGTGERNGDPAAMGLMTAWDGLGVEVLSDPGPWYAVDLHTGGARWRFVVLDTDREAMGNKWNDQWFWVPKVVGDDSYDHGVVVLTDGPGRMDGSVDRGSFAAEELLRLVRSHADADRLVMVIVGGTDVPAVVLPGGPWGEAWVTTGPSARATHSLQRLSTRLSLAQGYVDGLELEFARRSGRSEEDLEALPSFDPDDLPVAGYWDFKVAGPRAELTLQLASPTGWTEVPALMWTPSTGWRPR